MTKEERQKYKELTKVLPKMLKDKIKKYKFKKKDFMIWYSTKELFFDLLIGVKVKSDDKCYCTAIETIKPLWLDDLLWDLLKMETNKKEPLSLRTIGAFTVSGAELFKNETELKEWTISELVKFFFADIVFLNIRKTKLPVFHTRTFSLLSA